MVQESGEKTTWNASNPVNKRINTTNLKWWVYRISGCHQQYELLVAWMEELGTITYPTEKTGENSETQKLLDSENGD